MPKKRRARDIDRPLVVVVENDDAIRALLRRTLESENCTVLEARDAAEAHSLIEKGGPAVDLVLADIAEPGIRGSGGLIDLLDVRTKVLFLSVGTDEPSVQGEPEEGAPTFLHRPFRPNAIREKLRDLFGSASEGDSAELEETWPGNKPDEK